MFHNYIQNVNALNSSAHFATAHNGQGDVLIQLDDGEHQVRVKLSCFEADRLRMLLLHATEEAYNYHLSFVKQYTAE